MTILYGKIPSVAATEEHTWSEWTGDFDCTTKGGEQTRNCTVCGLKETRTLSAGHTWGEWEQTIAPGCTLAGEEHRLCTVCNEEQVREVGALGHSLTYVSDVPATCTSGGVKEYYHCTLCDEDFLTEAGGTPATADELRIEPLGHTVQLVEKAEPTCTHEGEQERTCANCNHKETQPLSKLGHDMQHIKLTAATCTQAGNIEYYYCNRCGKYFSDQQGLNEITGESIVTPALNHNWGEWVTDKDATCEESGHRYRACTRCDSKQEEAITATGHSYNSATHVCANCGDIQETQDLVFALASPEVYPGGSYVLTSTGVNRGEIVLPATYEGKPVTGIASGAVLSGVTSVQIPNTQTFYIYGGALASTVTRINYLGDIDGWAQLYFESGWAQGKYTLYSLSGSSFAAAKDVTISCDYIAAYAFENNGGLGSVTLDRVQRVEQFAFASSSVTSFNSGGISALGYGAFAGCGQLKSADLSSSAITSINAMTFTGCNLSELKLPAALKKVAASAVPNQPDSLSFAGSRDQWALVEIGAGNALENAVCEVGA